MAEKTVEQRCYEALKARGVTFAAAEKAAVRKLLNAAELMLSFAIFPAAP